MEVRFPNPFHARGEWFKGNLHTHTTGSDGVLSPEETVQRYAEAGYDFLAITDHNTLTRLDLQNPPLLLVPGEEANLVRNEAGGDHHLVLVGIEDHCDQRESIPALAEQVRAMGGLLILAHPYWSQLSTGEVTAIADLCTAVEVWNTSCEVSIGKGLAAVHWDDALSRGHVLWGVAVDDAHHHTSDHRPTDLCGAWISVKTPALTVDNVLNAIREGMFYASTGPEFRDVRIDENGVVEVETSPVRRITFISKNGRGERWTPLESDEITAARHQLTPAEGFVRIECEDALGRRAWTNPILVS